MTAVSVASLGQSASDEILIGDNSCGFNGYLKGLTISKDGNILDSKKNPLLLIF